MSNLLVGKNKDGVSGMNPSKYMRSKSELHSVSINHSESVSESRTHTLEMVDLNLQKKSEPEDPIAAENAMFEMRNAQAKKDKEEQEKIESTVDQLIEEEKEEDAVEEKKPEEKEEEPAADDKEKSDEPKLIVNSD